MTQKEFIKRSEREVKLLNGAEDEEVFEAWREGYIGAKLEIEQYYKNSIDYDNFINNLEEFINQKLETLK